MIRLFHVSDLHFGREDKEALAWFARTVETERPDAVVCTGDLTQRAKRDEFAAATRYLEQLPVPVTIEPGNHDLPYFNLFERFVRPYRRYGRLEKMIERPLDIRNVVVVPLKTTARFQWRHNWSWGVVGRRALAKTLALLETIEGGHVKLIACHHPLVDKEGLHSSGKTIRGREALAALAEAGAHAVLSGHVHDPFDIDVEVGGRMIRKIGAGTLSERVRDSAPSFNEIRVSDAGKIEVDHRWMESAAKTGAPGIAGAPGRGSFLRRSLFLGEVRGGVGAGLLVPALRRGLVLERLGIVRVLGRITGFGFEHASLLEMRGATAPPGA